MSEDLSDIINNVKSMVDSGNIPDNMKEMLSAISSGNNTSASSNANDTDNFNMDMNTILKIKTIIDNINTKDDPRANLLYSLKPYLRESRKSKLDQYVNILNMTKIANIINNESKENKGNV